MAGEGYLILDSDLHMMEPDDLWVRYLDEPYRSANPPRFFGGTVSLRRLYSPHAPPLQDLVSEIRRVACWPEPPLPRGTRPAPRSQI